MWRIIIALACEVVVLVLIGSYRHEMEQVFLWFSKNKRFIVLMSTIIIGFVIVDFIMVAPNSVNWEFLMDKLADLIVSKLT